jgi:hypothetical protein
MTYLGHSMLSWGRAGKLAQFVAGLTVLLDLIGAKRLRASGIKWGKASRRLIEVAGAFARPRMAVDLLLYSLAQFKYEFSDLVPKFLTLSYWKETSQKDEMQLKLEEKARLEEKSRILDERYGIRVGKLIAILMPLGYIVIWCAWVAVGFFYQSGYVVIGFLALLLLVLPSTGLILAFGLLIFAGITMAFVVIVLRPVAWLLDRVILDITFAG